MEPIIFTDWSTLGHTFIVGVLAYISLVIILRLTGKRTLSKMNAFDFVVTVAFGSTLASTILDPKITVAHGALAFFLLAGLQYVITWSSVRTGWVKRTVTGQPRIVFYKGDYVREALLSERVTRNEIDCAIRTHQITDKHEVEAVVLETDGSFSVLKNQAPDSFEQSVMPRDGESE